MPLTRHELREQLNKHLRTDAERLAFVVDHFPDVSMRASASLDADSLWNLLFGLHDSHEVESALHRLPEKAMVSLPRAQSIPGFRLPPVDPWFSGRTEELSIVERFLTGQRGVTLRGLGGLGKSSLAREYLHRNLHRFSFVGWLSADCATVLPIYPEQGAARRMREDGRGLAWSAPIGTERKLIAHC